MSSQHHPALLRTACEILFKNPVIILVSGLLYLYLVAVAAVPTYLIPLLSTTTRNVLWTGLFSLVTIAVGGLALCIMISISARGSKKHPFSMKGITYDIRKHWMGVVGSIIVLIAASALTNFLAVQIAKISIGPLGEQGSTVLLFFLLIAGLLGGIIFLSLMSFVQIVCETSFVKSLQQSIDLVRKNYLTVLVMVLAFFVLSAVIAIMGDRELLPVVVVELINALFVFPLFIISFTLVTQKISQNHDIRTA